MLVSSPATARSRPPTRVSEPELVASLVRASLPEPSWNAAEGPSSEMSAELVERSLALKSLRVAPSATTQVPVFRSAPPKPSRWVSIHSVPPSTCTVPSLTRVARWSPSLAAPGPRLTMVAPGRLVNSGRSSPTLGEVTAPSISKVPWLSRWGSPPVAISNRPLDQVSVPWLTSVPLRVLVPVPFIVAVAVAARTVEPVPASTPLVQSRAWVIVSSVTGASNPPARWRSYTVDDVAGAMEPPETVRSPLTWSSPTKVVPVECST